MDSKSFKISEERKIFRLVFGPYFGIAFFIAGITAGDAFSSPVSPQTHSANERFAVLNRTVGYIAVNGGLGITFPVISTSILSKIGINFRLAHQFYFRPDGTPYSSWYITGLNTYIVPHGRDEWKCLTLSGSTFLIKRNEVTDSYLADTRKMFSVRIVSPDHFEIKDSGNVVYSYDRGMLTSIAAPNSGVITVKCKGTLVCSLFVPKSPLAALDIKYDEDMHPSVFLEHGMPKARAHWEDGSLVSVVRFGASSLQLSYQNGLVSKITDGSKELALLWRENPGWRRGDSRWPLPFHLARCGDQYFEMKIEHRGFVITGRNAATQEWGRLCYNPLQRTLKGETPDGSYDFPGPQ